MLVAQIMTASPLAVAPSQTLNDVVVLMRSRRIRHLPVLEDSRLVGIVTDRDVKRATPSLHSGVSSDDYNKVLDGTLVSQVMTRDPMTVAPDAELKQVVEIFLEHKFGALPVVSEGALVGIVTEIDLLRAFHRML